MTVMWCVVSHCIIIEKREDPYRAYIIATTECVKEMGGSYKVAGPTLEAWSLL